MRGDNWVGASANVWRRIGVVGVVICAMGGVAAPGAPADRPRNPEELWRAYPLEQTPTTSEPAPAAAPAERRPVAPATEKSTTDPPWALFAAVVAASALLVGGAVVRRRRRAAAAPEGAAPDVPGRTPAPAAAPTARFVPTATAPAARTAPPAATAANGRPAAARGGPVCQIRWSRRGRWFYAEAIDTDGAPYRLGRSPRVDWPGPGGPPEDSPEARAALRTLAKDLRERGWRPLRARGVDFDERRWYARRFRWPTEAEAEAGPADSSPEMARRPRGPEMARRPGGER
jgi:hypothetical protein